MRRAGTVVAMLGAGALAVITLPPRHEVRPPTAGAEQPASYEERERRELLEQRHERRRVRPGIYRASADELALRNRVVGVEAAKVQAREATRRRAALASVPGQTWVPLGPTDAIHQYNSLLYDGVDSGRPSGIIVDPRDPNVVYVAVSGGGVWKTFDFLAPGGGTWMPLTDTQPNLAIGSLAMDPASPDTLYFATGDAFDVSGNTVQKTTDGGATWSDPVPLSGTYPAPNSTAARVRDIRSIAVAGGTVLAGTNVGLFVSNDGGASFALADLPNPGGRTLTESIWSVVSVGGGAWVVSGLTGCSDTSGPAPIYQGVNASTTCPAGNNAAIWRSPDGKAWTQVTVPAATGTGRVTLAAGGTANPATTAVYAYVGSVAGDATLGFWRSLDAGKTWANATGTLANPTKLAGGSRDCGTIDLGHDQSWYNQMIVVDPTNPDHVLAGGNLCGARTLNGTAASPKWELISHWLPNPQSGATANGQLPYVHADWHSGTIALMNGQVQSFAGSDGGVFVSADLFTQAMPEKVTWTYKNRGLATHLVYSVASGDPTTMNPFVMFGGLQDNGTRFRTNPATPTVFNQPVGGDGIGATVHASTAGATFWGSVEFGRMFCLPKAGVDCAEGQNWIDASAGLPQHEPDSPEEIQKDIDYAQGLPGTDDAEPFFVHYANVETDASGQSVLTQTDGRIWVATAASTAGATWKAISQDLSLLTPARGFSNITASRTIAGLYGAVGDVSAFPFYYSTTGNTLSTWTVSQPVQPTGTAARMLGPSSMDFPPVLPAGTAKGQVYIGAFTGSLNDGSMVPDNKGRLYRTTDFGQTWTSIVGADPAHRLPNVPVYVVKYDPVTPTTIYAGTDIGVYLSLDDGATWNRMGDGLPMVPVRDIYVAKNQEFIRIATYGRGFWEIYPSATANRGVSGNGDYDRNLRIDWVDLAAMASRQGVSPASPAAPFYTWLLDMTATGMNPPLQSIDGADLDALLKKFGGHP